MFKDNLVQTRKLMGLTQEDIADKLGVTRQSVAKWESGESVPDLDKCKQLADIFGVSLDDLANYEPEDNLGVAVPPKGKHLFGLVTVGEKGQIVIPAKARKIFEINPGDQIVVLGDEGQGIALVKTENFLSLANMVSKLKK
ncbi:MAG: helix-turn-helix transcriptional regulator [Lachnospiraceae bacterium]|jgi:AbrB family looped-hinge helix DNA binding protein|nr:helix-turn-helix transcriptional regulator [Lachnospiraceae bacterium]SDA54149.1 looped-hinge helix DNA binding domain-containing protein, AbrB family [Lachnospiraceae bacterium G11]